MIFLEPNKEEIKTILLQPFDMLAESVGRFRCLEKDLVSLLKLNRSPPYPTSFPLKRNDAIISDAEAKILGCLNDGFSEI